MCGQSGAQLYCGVFDCVHNSGGAHTKSESVSGLCGRGISAVCPRYPRCCGEDIGQFCRLLDLRLSDRFDVQNLAHQLL